MAESQELLAQAQELQDAGDYYSLRRVGRSVIEAATREGNALAHGRGWTFVGVAEMRLGEVEPARAAFDRAIELFETCDHPRGIAGAKMNLGTLALDVLGDAREARRIYEEALPLVAAANDEPYGIGLANVAEICRAEGDLEAALRFASEAEACFRRCGADWRRALTLITLGHIHSLRGDVFEAVASMHAAHATVLASANPASVAFYYDVYALIAADYDAAETGATVAGFTAAYRAHYGLIEDRSLAIWRVAAEKKLAAALTPSRRETLRARGAGLHANEVDALLERLLPATPA